jgi:hypothetical protein
MGRYHVATAIAAIALFAGQAAGQVCVGNCGTLGPNGVVTAPPGSPTYQWVSTYHGTTDQNLGSIDPSLGSTLGSATNGSTQLSALFHANSGDQLVFYFNYVTSDGAGYADYAWSSLLNPNMSQAAMLVTARTEASGTIIPGTGMPINDATLVPSSVPIIPPPTPSEYPVYTGGPDWLPLGVPLGGSLGGSSGFCWAPGCGYTGWVESDYTILTTGFYFLQFGVTNWLDTSFDSGLAFSGSTIAGVPIDTGTIPEPGSLVLLASGLVSLVPRIRRKFKR